MKDDAPDYPFYDVLAEAERLFKKGHDVYQKFTCSHCGNRLTIDVPNSFHKEGHCDSCGHMTNIEAQGCNYMVVMKGKSFPKAHRNSS